MSESDSRRSVQGQTDSVHPHFDASRSPDPKNLTAAIGRVSAGGQSSGGSSNTAAIVWGAIATVLFYLIVPWIPGTTEFVNRYFCGHPVEYACTAMCFIGIAILWGKLRALPAEFASLKAVAAFAEEPHDDNTQSDARSFLSHVEQWRERLSAKFRGTVVARRLNESLRYAHGRQEGGLEEHLRYLADLANDRLHQSFSLLRTIAWAIPILGFLGTVLGITIAIANVTPEQLDSSLPEVTAGLAIAFDTTAQALAMSLALVFGAFLVERGEQAILNDVEQFGIEHLLNRLTPAAEDSNQDSSRSVMVWTDSVLQQQTQIWSRRLIDLQEVWAGTMSAQANKLCAALDQETESTLQVHRDSVARTQEAYSDVLRQSTDAIVRQFQQSLNGFSVRVDAWQNAIQASSLAAAQQSEELHRFGRTLLQLTESEERLSQMQALLNDNLQSIQVVETLEQTVNSLNAAVHVLTAKTQFRSAA